MFRFRFYGVEPVEWHEGANDGHAYDLTFRHTPTAEEKRALARAITTVTKKAAATSAERAWVWQGRSARLHLGERKSGKHAAYFAAAQRAMLALHDACPLEVVVFRGSWGDPVGESAWDAWSLEQGPVEASVFSATAPGTPDPDFERERRIHRVGRAVVEATEAEAAAVAARGELALLPTTAPIVLPAVPPGMAERFELSIPHYVTRSLSGRIIAIGTRFGTVAWLDDHDAIRAWGTEKLDSAWPQVFPDGASVLFTLDGRLMCVSLADATAAELWSTSGPNPVSVCPIHEDLVAFNTTEAITLLARTPTGWSVADTYHPGKNTWLRGRLLALHSGRVLVYVEGDHVRVLRIDEGKLDEFGRIEPPTPRRLHQPVTDLRRVTGVDAKTQAPLELVNIDARWRTRWGEPPWT